MPLWVEVLFWSLLVSGIWASVIYQVISKHRIYKEDLQDFFKYKY